jgi:hypothetical protein
MKTNVHSWSYVAQFSDREMFQTTVLEKIKNTLFCLTFFSFFRKSCRLWDNVEKQRTAEQATDYNTAHVHSTLDIWGYKHTLRICNTYCFSTATMVAQMRLNVILYVHCLSCSIYTRIKILRGTRWRSWFRHCATSRKVAGSIFDGVIGFFSVT